MESPLAAEQSEHGRRRVKPAFELLNHTADIAIRAVAPTMEELVHLCAVGLYSVIGELTTLAVATERRTLFFSGADPATLIRDYLSELLFLIEKERLVVAAENTVRIEPNGLFVDVLLEKLDVEASIFSHEVKAVTYHDLCLAAVDGGFELTLVVDI